MMGKHVVDRFSPDIEGEVVKEEYDAASGTLNGVVTIKLTRSHRCASVITEEGHVADEARLAGDLLSLRRYAVKMKEV